MHVEINLHFLKYNSFREEFLEHSSKDFQMKAGPVRITFDRYSHF